MCHGKEYKHSDRKRKRIVLVNSNKLIMDVLRKMSEILQKCFEKILQKIKLNKILIKKGLSFL